MSFDTKSKITVTNELQYRTLPITAPSDRNLMRMAEAGTIVSVHYTANVAGTDGGAVTAMLKKCIGTTAPASGTDILAAAIDLKTTAHNTATGTLVANQSTLTFAAGDRLALDVTGTTTAVDGFFTVGYQLL